MKATAQAPSNIAFIKYWGRKNETLRLPTNGSLSMNLSNLLTTTTVEFSPTLKEDSVLIDKQNIEREGKRVSEHLDRIRALAGINIKAKVVSSNSFPSGTGLSSSASGFAALTVAAVTAAGLSFSEKELAILARQGSGSACRSIPDGFVEWTDGDTSETSYAYSVHPPEYWDIVDIVVVVSQEKKDVPTSEGQTRVGTSPFALLRQDHMAEKLRLAKNFMSQKNFVAFGELLEREALEMHAVMLTSYPPLIYWTPGTLRLMKMITQWRASGIEVYFTINTGQDVHLICQQKNQEKVTTLLHELDFVKEIIGNYPAKGTRLIVQHLF